MRAYLEDNNIDNWEKAGNDVVATVLLCNIESMRNSIAELIAERASTRIDDEMEAHTPLLDNMIDAMKNDNITQNSIITQYKC